MSDYKSHGDKPIEFCGDQEGWIAVGSLTSDSPNSPCFPRSVLLGVGRMRGVPRPAAEGRVSDGPAG